MIGEEKPKLAEITFLMDIGAFYSAIPQNLADRLNLKAFLDDELTLADKRRVKAGITLAYIRLLNRSEVFR